MKIKVLELFGGIGADCEAFKNTNIDFEVVDYVEIDKYAVMSYNAMNNINFEPQDITKWDKDIEVDFIMHGSPCQSFSVAGKQEGGEKGSGTKSSLMWETVRIINKLKPKFIMWENVKNVVGKKHKHVFDEYIKELEEIGYNSYWQVLNTKDYGLPQNRERVFILSIRNDVNKGYEFPKPQELKLRLKDMLESEVDEKYYLKQEIAEKLITSIKNKEVSKTIRCGGKGSLTTKHEWDLIAEPKVINPLKDKTEYGWHFEQQVYDKEGITRTVKAGGGSGNIPKVLEPKINQIGMLDIKGNEQVRRVYDSDGISPTLNTMQGGNRQPKVLEDFKIRKLTPKECWRLMGFGDDQFKKAEKVCSNSQLYKQAGNSIVVNVLEAIFEKMVEFNYLGKRM